MSTTVSLKATRVVTVMEMTLTNNFVPMAKSVGVYEAVWRPWEINASQAKDILPILKLGKTLMEGEKKGECLALQPTNCWGTYEYFLFFLESYISACENDPDATFSIQG